MYTNPLQSSEANMNGVQSAINFNHNSSLSEMEYRNNDDRIAGGGTAIPNEFPWMAYLELFTQSKVVPPPTDPNVCAGTLINDRWILTSADCLDGLVINNFLWDLHQNFKTLIFFMTIFF